jgi:hypothetical protein
MKGARILKDCMFSKIVWMVTSKSDKPSLEHIVFGDLNSMVFLHVQLPES